MLRHDDSFSLCHSFIIIHYRLTTYQTYHTIIFPCSCLHLHGKPTLAPSSHCRTLQVLISYSRNVTVEISIFTSDMTAYCIGYMYIYNIIYIILTSLYIFISLFLPASIRWFSWMSIRGFGLTVAALAHDIGHMGRSNVFLTE